MSNHDEYARSIQRQDSQNKELHRSGLKHWFSKEPNAKSPNCPTSHDQSYSKSSIGCGAMLPCPAGIDPFYWENLSKIEQNWSSRQTAMPSLEERRQLWQQEASLRTAKESKPKKDDYFSQAVRPADPFEEPIKRKARLLRSKAEQNVVDIRPNQIWQIAVND